MKPLVKVKYTFVLIFILSMVSCDYLDYDESSYLAKDDIFSDFARAKGFLTSIYAYLPDDFVSIDGAMRAAATDEAVHIWDLSNVHRMTNGTWSAIQPLDNVWGNMYQAIRAANMFLLETQGQDFDDRRYNLDYAEIIEQFEIYPYEARFLRAFFYFELIKRYKNVPLITSVLTPDEAKTIQPSTFEAVVQFIVNECDEIAQHLPADFASFSSAQETGRATKGAAMALKARTLLYAASPLHNPANNLELWQIAARAAKDIIDMNQYILLANYSQNYNNIASRELIFGKREGPTNAMERRNFPVGYEGGNTGTCPSQNLVDAYDMALTGLPITHPFSGYNPDNPYAGRDPRLNQTIILNNSQWKGQVVESYVGGKNGPPITNASNTGYYLKKHLIEAVSLEPTNTTTREHTWILFRYAEVLLNYAEAMNEAYGPDNASDLGLTAREAVRQVRARVNMPGYPILSQDDFRTRLRNERRVELAFEDHRFWDVRRWKIGDTTTDIYGMKITKEADGSFSYEKTLVEQRYFADYMNLYPIPQSEIYINENLQQNSGW
jgi:starch-binding outer membrane protein, SusD/RagB family